MGNARKLRELLGREEIVVAAGAYDGLSALLVKEAGFDAVFCTGGGISRSFGYADVGYLTLTELVDRVGNMVEVTGLPCIVDADSGFGNALNIQRTVQLLERAGAAGIHIEDEEFPARGRSLADRYYSTDEMVRRLEAMVAARRDPDLVLIARTSVLPGLGLDEAIARANRYAQTGVDMVYVEYAATPADVEEVARRVAAPKLIGQNKDEVAVRKPAELQALGFRMLTYPADSQLAAIHAMRGVLKHLREHGTSLGYTDMVTFEERDRAIGADRYKSVLRTYLPE